MLVAAANDAIEQCWTWADWPELCRIEERTIQGNETTGFYLDYDQGGGETPMGEIFRVFRDNPATSYAPREVTYTLLGDSIRFANNESVPPTVYVRFRLRPDTYSSTNLTATVPAILAKAAAYLLTADLQEEDGQYDKALAMEQKAEAELIAQRDKYYFQQGQPSMWTANVGPY